MLSKQPAPDFEIINDLNDDLVNLYRVIQSRESFEELRRRLTWTPYAESELDLVRIHEDGLDAVERARRVLIASWMYLPCYGADLWRASSWRVECRPYPHRNKIRNLARSWEEWKSAIDSIHDRLSAVAISKRDAMEFINMVDQEGCLLYVDPPYTHESRGKHRYLFDSIDHQLLVGKLITARSMVVLSGYPDDTYSPLEAAGWIRLEHKARANLSQGDRVECLWINPVALEAN